MTIQFDGEHLSPAELPKPCGWMVLLAPIKIEDTTSGGIIMVKDEVKAQETVRFVSKVLAMGPLAYTGDKFKPHPNAAAKPWCKVGDIVVSGQYSGITLPCKDKSGTAYYLRAMNDDEIKMVVSDVGVLNV